MQTNEQLQHFQGKNEFEEDNLEGSLTKIEQEFSSVQLINELNSYKPKSDLVSIRQLSLSENIKLKKYKEAAFYGEFVNGKRHGLGIMMYKNRRIYEGQWQSDFKHGQGFQLFPNGCTYKGIYINGKPQGVGRYQWPNGEYYQGEWLSGMKHGSGLWSGAKGDSYVGEWKFGKADGFGVHLWINGDRYEGEFKQSLKHGQGTQKFISGDLYKGSFFQGKPQGYGQYFWRDGSFYKGEFRKGFREGNGVWKRAEWNGDKYEGQYVRDKKQGYGIYNWNTGNVYKGHYFEDLRDGYGEMFWTDGSSYKGEWRKGNQEGEGTLYTPERGMSKGLFRDNELVELYSQLQPLNNPPAFKRRNKRAESNLAGKIVISPFKKEHGTCLSPIVRYRSSSNRTRQSFQKGGVSKLKQTVNPQALRQIGAKIQSTRYLKAEVPHIQLSPVQQSKQHLGHSSVLLKYLERRMKSSSGNYGQIRSLRRSNIHDINTRLKNMELDNP